MIHILKAELIQLKYEGLSQLEMEGIEDWLKKWRNSPPWSTKTKKSGQELKLTLNSLVDSLNGLTNQERKLLRKKEEKEKALRGERGVERKKMVQAQGEGGYSPGAGWHWRQNRSIEIQLLRLYTGQGLLSIDAQRMSTAIVDALKLRAQWSQS